MAYRKDTRKAHIKASSKGQAALERAEYFSRPGATAADWRGGRKVIYTDRRKAASKKACRGRVR